MAITVPHTAAALDFVYQLLPGRVGTKRMGHQHLEFDETKRCASSGCAMACRAMLRLTG